MRTSMTKTIFACTAALLISSNAWAECGSARDTWFSCMTKKGKLIELCNEKTKIRYTFGFPNRPPEISLSVAKDGASTSQPDGNGRWWSYAVDIPNGSTIYSVFWGYDRITENHDVEAGVHVTLPNGKSTTVYCASNSEITNNLEDVDLKPTE